LKRKLVIAALFAVLAGMLVYAGDDVSLRIRIPRREPFGSVIVQRTYAVPMKDRKTDYMFAPPALQTCVNSLFPHFGYPPCWYLVRHKRQQITVGKTPRGPDD